MSESMFGLTNRFLEGDDAPPGKIDELLWLCVVGTFMGFVYAFGIGANDVANAFASTVASKSLTLKQAVFVASICEFSGAMFLGASVTKTVRSGIFDLKLYGDEPEIIMLGMATSIIVASVMLLVATYFALPVSTTHTVVGCIMGFSICAKGFESINWDIAIKIFSSWAISPLVGGTLAFIFFGSVRLFVMRSEESFVRAYYVFPLVLMNGIGIDVFYVLYKGFNNFEWAKDLSVAAVLPAAFGAGALVGAVWLWPVGPIIMQKILDTRAAREAKEAADAKADQKDAEKAEEAALQDNDGEEETDKANGITETTEEEQPKAKKSLFQALADNTVNQDLHSQSMHENAAAADLWDNQEVFDHDAEQLFTYVQVFTACLNSFAHGANDVANAIAPVSAVLYIYQHGELESKAPVQKWLLAYGGIGITLGVYLYGYKVMKSLGYKVCALSPSRGASAELAASLFVVTASFLEIPVSTTQTICGAVTGVGLASGVKNVNWWMVLRFMMGWVYIFFISVFLSAGLFSFVAFSPSLLGDVSPDTAE